MGVASLVIGILSFLIGLVPLVGYFVIVLAILGIVLGLLALKNPASKGMGTAGLVLNILTVGWFIVKIMLWGAILGA